MTAWDVPDDRDPGLYCGACKLPIEVEIADLAFSDNRIGALSPEEFDASAVADELRATRVDAEWSSLHLKARQARFGDVPSSLDKNLLEVLERNGQLPLYVHQTRAIDLALRGAQVVQATSTGSGKSLGFVVPILDALLADSTTTAILVFPLRALANDQLNKLATLGITPDPWISRSYLDLKLTASSDEIGVGRYDGSTLDHERPKIRRDARIVVTTPDMLHASILRMATSRYKDGTSWQRILEGLRYVVLDEIHAYRGTFGSNVAQVIRRLRRVCFRHGAEPQFLVASATIGNPKELAERLTGVEPFDLVDGDGSPQAARTVLICNPPLIESAASSKDGDTKRMAPQTIAIDLMSSAALGSEEHPPVRSLCFARSRVEVFALTNRLRARLQELRRADLANAVSPYAATMLADDREEAEGKLRDGSTLGIVSTNALELGIDIPELSIAFLCGYPGQAASFRQRAGRVGRRGQGLVVLVVGDDPLQQYVARSPSALDTLLRARAEDVVINADSPEVIRRYGLAPGQEELKGLSYEDARFFGKPAVDEWLSAASGKPTLIHSGIPYWHVDYSGDPYSNLRSIASGGSFQVMAVSKREHRPIGAIDNSTASRDCFVGAVWPTATDTYRVVGFDTRRHEIYCEGPIKTDYLTRGVPVDTVEVCEDMATARPAHGATLGYSGLRISRQVFSYKRLFTSGLEESAQVGDPRWPQIDFETEGLRLELTATLLDGVPDPPGAVLALEHALLAIAPIVVACDPFDLDSESDRSVVYLYDSFGAGLGLSRVVFERFDEILTHARNSVTECSCESGCPGCVVLSRRPDRNRGLSKHGAIALLNKLAPVGALHPRA